MIDRRLWDIDTAECTGIAEDDASKQELKSSFNHQDPATVHNNPIMMVKSIDGEGQVVQVLEPPTGEPDQVSPVHELSNRIFLTALYCH